MRVLVALLTVSCGTVAGSVGAYEDACADCHPTQARAFAEGGMADAARSPVFVALREEASESDPATAALCDGCHTPAVGTDHGLSCATCHAAVGHQGVENGLLIWDLDGPVRGPTGSVDPAAPHDAAGGGLLSDSELCGTCHDVRGPAGFEESPFAHWQDSPAAAEGIGCVSCHMSPTPGADRAELPPVEGPAADVEGLAPRPLADHRFVGLNGGPEAAVLLLQRAVGLTLEREGDLVRVEVTNLGAGHDLPDGASFVREVWVDVADAAGPLAPPAWLSTRLLRDGVEVVNPLEADRQVRGALPPGGALAVDVTSSGAVRACVRFRQVRPDLLDLLGLEPDLAGPVYDVACVEEEQADSVRR